MPKFFDSISDDLAAWAMKQSVFFTASAPVVGKHINVSPKGLPSSTFTIFSPNQAGYIDATGSGSETISHIYENGRVTIMFCSFETAPRILRFFCTGNVVEWDRPEFPRLLEKMGKKGLLGARAVIVLDVFKVCLSCHTWWSFFCEWYYWQENQVQTSCGYGVPRLVQVSPSSDDAESASKIAGFQDREMMGHWASNKIEKNELLTYQQTWNSNSLDGLTGLRSARRGKGEVLWVTDLEARLRRIVGQKDSVIFGFLLACFAFWLFRSMELVRSYVFCT